MAGVAALLVALSTHAVAAPVQLSLRTTFELQCGWPGPAVAVTFPPAERFAARIAVTVDGKRPAAVVRTGDTVTLKIARPGAVMCDAIGPGVVRIVFTAGIRNPGHGGRYTIRVRHSTQTATGTFTVS